jgi:F0F1-type ATP synthase assembly protein I
VFYNASGVLMSRDSRKGPPEAGSLAFAFVALVLVFTGLGYLADRWVHTGPWLMVTGVFVGAGLGFVYLVYILFSTGSGGRTRKKSADEDSGPDGRSL